MDPGIESTTRIHEEAEKTKPNQEDVLRNVGKSLASMKLEESQKALERSESSKEDNEVIEFNVAGQIVATTKQTILKEKEWLLARLVQGKPVHGNITKDSSGRYFIDRDYSFFFLILKYLRNGTVNLPKYGTTEWDEIWRETEFYGLQSLLDKMERAALEELAASSIQDIRTIEEEQERVHQRLTAKELLRYVFAESALII